MATSDSPLSVPDVTLAVARGAASGVKVLVEEHFNGNSLPDDWFSDSYNGGQLTLANGYLRGEYPANGDGTDNIVSIPIPLDEAHSDIYIETRCRMPGPRGGFKFIKIFGERVGDSYANTTFGLVYGSGNLEQVSFGDGSTPGNDTTEVINLDGTHKDWIGRSFGQAVIRTPQNAHFSAADWGTDWHTVKLRAKFNSGTSPENEIADGAYYLEIDGVVYVDAYNIFNRHYTNGPIQAVKIFDYARANTDGLIFDYDYIRITSGGFLNQ